MLHPFHTEANSTQSFLQKKRAFPAGWCLGLLGDLEPLWPLHVLQKFLDGVDVGVGRFKALDLAWVEAELVSPPALLCLHHQGQLSHFPKARGRASFPALMTALTEGMLSQALQPMRGGISSTPAAGGGE